MPSLASSLLSPSVGRENKKSCEALLMPLGGTDKLESEAGSIFSPSCKSAERTPARRLANFFRKQKRRYHSIPPPPRQRKNPLV
jgi:hypothetical protein